MMETKSPDCLHKNNSNSLDILIGKRIRLRRQNLAYSQDKLGQMIGLTFQQIQKYESGKNRISASRLWELSQILNIPINYFFMDAEKSKTHDNEIYTEKTMRLINAYNSISNKDLADKFFKLLMSMSSRYISKDEE